MSKSDAEITGDIVVAMIQANLMETSNALATPEDRASDVAAAFKIVYASVHNPHSGAPS